MSRFSKASYTKLLNDFISSTSTFRAISRVPHTSNTELSSAPIKTLYVLDASFNPPTRAHSRMALSALKDDAGAAPKSLVILLSTQNADKASKPAPLEERLVMMRLFAEELKTKLPRDDQDIALHIGLAKAPYFHDKAQAISEDELFCDAQQVYLMGFDTLIRLLDPKYYPPEEKLKVLEPFLDRHRLRVTRRLDDDSGSREDQDRYVTAISHGDRAEDGADARWGKQIELVEGRTEAEEAISSTLARKAAKANPKNLDRYVLPSVRDYILSQKLYIEE